MAIDPAVAAAVAATGRGQKAAIKQQGNNLNNVTTQNGRQGIIGKGGNFQPLGAAALGRIQQTKPGTAPARTPPIVDPNQIPQPPGAPVKQPPSSGTVNLPAPATGTPGLSTFMPPPAPTPMTFNGAPGAVDFANAASGAAGGAGNIDNAIGALKSQLSAAGAQVPDDGSSGGNVGGPNTRFGLNPGAGGPTPWMPQVNGPNMHGGGLNGDQAPNQHGGGGPLGGPPSPFNPGDRLPPSQFNPQPSQVNVGPANPAGPAGRSYLNLLKQRLQARPPIVAGGTGGLSGIPTSPTGQRGSMLA